MPNNNNGWKSAAVEDALAHIWRVCEWCESVLPDDRIQAILSPRPLSLLVTVTTFWGIRVRSGPGLNYSRVDGLSKGSTRIVTRRIGQWGKIALDQWITLDPRYTHISYLLLE